jgi:hypothetical protein
MTGHGFRATASTLRNEQGWQPDVSEFLGGNTLFKVLGVVSFTRFYWGLRGWDF